MVKFFTLSLLDKLANAFLRIIQLKTSRHIALLSIAVGLASACDERPCTPPQCDIRHRSCQREVMAATACLRETKPREVKVKVIALSDYIDREMNQASEEEIARFDQQQAALALLGLEPKNDSYKSSVEEAAKRVAAYYSESNDNVVILDDGNPMDTLSAVDLLVHEFSHALQFADDQATIERADSSLDSQLASAAMIEGDATWTADRAFLLLLGRDPQEIDWSALYNNWLDTVRSSYMEEPHKVRLAYSYFPYAFGAKFVQRFSANAVMNLVFSPPATTRGVMRGTKSPNSDLERKISLPDLQDHTLIGAETLGSFIISGYINAVFRESDEPQLSTWLGIAEDSLSLWRRDSDEALSAVLRIRLATSINSDELDRARYTLQETDLGPGSHTVTLDDRILTIVASAKRQITDELSDGALSYRTLTYAELETEYVDSNIALAALRSAHAWQ